MHAVFGAMYFVCFQVLNAKGKNFFMYLSDLEKAFVRVPRKVMESGMQKKGLLEILVGSAMSPYKGAKTGVRDDFELLEEFEVEVVMYKESVFSG